MKTRCAFQLLWAVLLGFRYRVRQYVAQYATAEEWFEVVGMYIGNLRKGRDFEVELFQ